MAHTQTYVGAGREIAFGGDERWQAALRSWDRRLEWDEATHALERFEAIARADSDPNAWAWCARASFFLGDYARGERESRRLHERGAKLGRRALALEAEHVSACFWTGCCLARYVDAVGVLRGTSHVPELVRLMLRVDARDPDYFQRGLARFLGQALIRQPVLFRRVVGPALPDLSPERVLRDLRRSVDEDPPFALTFQTLGQVAHAFGRDRHTVEEMLQRLEKLDPDAVPALAPENHLDGPRARKTLQALL